MVHQKKSLRAVIFNSEGTLFSASGNMRPLSLAEGEREKDQGRTGTPEMYFMPGAIEILSLLHRLGFKLGLLSLYPQECKLALKRAGLPADNFVLVSGSKYEDYYQESHKIVFLIKECLQKMMVDIDESIYVGSTPDDYWAGEMVEIDALVISPSLNNLGLPHSAQMLFGIQDLTYFIYDIEKKRRTLFLTEGIYKSFRGLSSKFSAFSERYRIPPAQMAAMQKLRKKDGVAISELAKEMGLLLSSISGLVNRMIKQGLIIKRKDERDSRVSKIYLTEKGREIISNLSSFSLEIEAYFEKCGGKEELLCLSKILRMMTDVLDTKPYLETESTTITGN